MTYIIRYELSAGNETIKDELVVLANSREQASERFLAVLQQKYGDAATLLSLDISRENVQGIHVASGQAPDAEREAEQES